MSNNLERANNGNKTKNITLLGLKVIGSDDDLPQIGNDENVA